MRLSTLIKAINGKVADEKDGEREILSLSADSRTTREGSLFFCLSAEQSDASAYAAEATRKGAVAVVTQWELNLAAPQILVEDCRLAVALAAACFYGNPAQSLSIIGVTGTNGKTTTSYMLRAILEASGKKTGLIGTLGVLYGERSLPATLTTPDPIDLHQTLAKMRAEGVEYVVMEVSAHALYFQKTAGISFSVCIFSNLTQDHLDFFPDMNAYKQAKLKLFLPEICPLAVVNGDEPVGREIGELRAKCGGKTFYYGLATPADAFAVITDEGRYGVECLFNVSDTLCRASLSLMGRHNVYNALSAASAAVALGCSAEEISAGLKGLKEVKGRLQRIAAYKGADIYVDFAHTPDGLAKSLDSLKRHCEGRLICLFGCGGNRDKTKRPLMGETAARRCHFCVLTSDNPRYEDPLDVLSEIERGYRRFSNRYVIVPDRQRAIEYAVECIRAGDILLIAGKGGEEYQEIMGIKYPFNDQTALMKIIKQKENGAS